MKLFQSIFAGRERVGRYPDSLIQMAIERAVDGTDPRLRLLPNYRGRLREPVIHAIDHVVGLVDALAAPVAAGPDGYRSDARLPALFASLGEMLQLFGRDRALTDYRSGLEGQAAGHVVALLMARREERNVLGMDLTGDQVRRDVAQVSVSFAGHRLLEPRNSETESRRFLKRRAFDHLLVMALDRINEAEVQRTDLRRQRDLLQQKLRGMQRGSLGFDVPEASGADRAALEAELDDVSDQLQALGADANLLEAHLDIVAEGLRHAEDQLRRGESDLCLSPMNIRVDPGDRSARHMVFEELENARGGRATVMLVRIATRDLPQREDLVTAAARYL